MTTLLAIDPGDTYVGYALFDDLGPPPHDWQCTQACISTEPVEFLFDLAESLLAHDFDIIVYEKFQLRADKTFMQEGSELKTAQMIGTINWLVEAQNRHAAEHARAEELGRMTTCQSQFGTCVDLTSPLPRGVVLVGQQPWVQGQKSSPIYALLRRKGIPLTSERMGALPHGRSAEAHGWYYIGREFLKWGL